MTEPKSTKDACFVIALEEFIKFTRYACEIEFFVSGAFLKNAARGANEPVVFVPSKFG